ncbi:kinase-like domain-containing protein [Lipomyces tetrasporus]
MGDSTAPLELPKNLGFYVGDAIGQGAFATVHLCQVFGKATSVFAVKFVHKPTAKARGGLSSKDIIREITLHKACSAHKNIITLFGYNEDENWIWLKMQAAMGGDLFDKIEPDVGVHEDICQMYFQQLVGAIEFIHSQGIAHRDVKPENILLDADGNLMLSDFGFATVFERHGTRKQSTTICGSAPYCAPEVVSRKSYDSDLADIWSCGVALFVLLSGCTPWQWAVSHDPDYARYKKSKGKVKDYPWDRLPGDVLSLLRKLMRENPRERMPLKNVRMHPWFKRPNKLISPNGQCADPIRLAERLILSMHINVDEPNIRDDQRPMSDRFHSCSQPTELKANIVLNPRELNIVSATRLQSQPMAGAKQASVQGAFSQSGSIQDDVSLLQFSQRKLAQIPDSLTQRASRFNELCPPTTMNKFFAAVPLQSLSSRLAAALHELAVPVDESHDVTRYDGLLISVTTFDRRKCVMMGTIKCTARHQYDNFVEVVFSRSKGDPLEWRYFFKRVAKLCMDIIYTDEK